MLSNPSRVLGFFDLFAYTMLVAGSYSNHTELVSSTPSSISTSSFSVNSTVNQRACSLLASTLQVLFFLPKSEISNGSAPESTVATTLVADGFTLFVSIISVCAKALTNRP